VPAATVMSITVVARGRTAPALLAPPSGRRIDVAGAWSVLRLFGARWGHRRLSNVAYQRQLLSEVIAGHLLILRHRRR
jgi:hypothetical protein